MSEWQTITETSPPPGFYLVHEDGAIRTMMRNNDGSWENPAIPLLIDPVGNRLVPREVRETRPGHDLILSDCIYEPTDWMHLPEMPGS